MAVRNNGTIATQAQAKAAATSREAGSSSRPGTIQQWIKTYKGQFARALPDVITPERFTRIALSAITSNPSLQECSTESLMGALMTAAQLGLEPNTPLGQAYLIPYNGVCTFQIGYKGMLDLAYRSGQVKSIQAHIVYENDIFEFEYGLNPKLRHIPAMGRRGRMTHAYAVFKLVNDGEGFQVMSEGDILEHAQRYSKSVNRGPWKTDFEGMAKKTVLKMLLKYAPMKSGFARAMSVDETAQIMTEPSGGSELEMQTAYITEDNGTMVDTATGDVVRGGAEK